MPTPRGGSRPWRRKVTQVIRRDSGICHLCGQPGATSADHLIPVAHGGSDNLDNLAAAHPHCNRVRGKRPIATARAELQPDNTGWQW